ncbi:MAG: hypothetical protein M1813_007967 [Trichoglossum hirsutum]|nr:MAG: hypothetical protein M1813_007967 [Trichoglossum hirsutum]
MSAGQGETVDIWNIWQINFFRLQLSVRVLSLPQLYNSEALDKVVLPSEPLSTDKDYQGFCKQTFENFSHQIGTRSMMS